MQYSVEIGVKWGKVTMNEKLHFTPEEMRKMGYQVVDRIVDHLCQLPDKPVTRNSSPSQLEKALGESLPEQGISFEKIMQQLDEVVFSQIMHLDHPRFFAFVPGPSNYIGTLATFLASGLNVFAGTWLEASGPAQVERVTVDWLGPTVRSSENGRGIVCQRWIHGEFDSIGSGSAGEAGRSFGTRYRLFLRSNSLLCGTGLENPGVSTGTNSKNSFR